MYQITHGTQLYLKKKNTCYLKFICNWALCIGSGHLFPSSELIFWWGGTVETDSHE